MIRRTNTVACLAVLMGCCAPATEEPTVTQPEDGPIVHSHLEVMESEPPQYAVTSELQVPTASWELEVQEVRRDGDVTVVELKLTEPAADELVAQVVSTLRVRAKLDARPQVVHVYLSRWQRGVEYFVPPEHRLVGVLEP